jgi:mono/diheme cytochrome c family protein
MRPASRLLILSCAFTVSAWTLAAAQDRESGQPHADAKMANPVKATAASIAGGKTVYDAQCVACHGATAKGDGKMAAQMNPAPPDLTDATWKHGSSDGEIFTMIRDGAKGTGMRGFGGKLSANDIWNLVNYLHSLGPKRPSSH